MMQRAKVVTKEEIVSPTKLITTGLMALCNLARSERGTFKTVGIMNAAVQIAKY